MRKFLSWRFKRETNWKAVADVKFRDPMLNILKIMLIALKILTSERVKRADIHPPVPLPIVLLFLVFVQCTLEQI